MIPRILIPFNILLFSVFFSGMANAQSSFDFFPEPILYQSAPAKNEITRLQQRLEAGRDELEFNSTRGYLDSILQRLSISPKTQALVYSKTSLQHRPISPANPRALYYNDEIYIGWVPGGAHLELIVSDNTLGSVFYTLKQEHQELPRFQRDRGECLQCHANRRTQDVPGPLVRSLYTSSSGQPIYNLGSYLSDHTSPTQERWGGYYVTGSHGNMRHMGNLFVRHDDDLDEIDYFHGANRLRLPPQVNRSIYLTNTSDIVALMVLEHQTQMQNLITKAIYEERRADHYDTTFNLDVVNGGEFTKRRIAKSVERLLTYMFFVDEFPLTAKVKGTSSFTSEFTRRKPATEDGRSLYQMDLQTRIFKYPLSYMIYTETFSAIGPKTRAVFNDRIQQILGDEPTGSDRETYRHLTPSLKAAIRDILSETHPTLGHLFN